jgi:glycosyltransferase involved in cell wall biosynthesis
MAEPLRIALVGQRSIPATYGGVEVYAEELAARLVERGHSVTAFCAEEGRTDTTEHRGVTVRYVPVAHGKHTRALSQAFSSSIRCLGNRFDVVHYMAMGPTIASPLVRIGSRAAVVATIQGRDDQRAKWSRPAQLMMRASLGTLRRVPHRIISVSQELYDDFRPYAEGRLRRVPNGVDVPRPAHDAEDVVRALDLVPGAYVLFAGRLVPEKRVLDLIAGFRRTSVPHTLAIAGGSSGTDDYVDELRAAAEGDERIRFLGHRSSAEVDALNRHAALFALTSELEGLPLALLEAAGRGVPLLVSDLPCNLEVVGEPDAGAVVVEVGAVDQIADGIERILGSPGASAAAACRSDAVLDAFGWESVVDRIEEVYREAVDVRRGVSHLR